METRTVVKFIPEFKIEEDIWGVEYDNNNQRLLSAYRIDDFQAKQYVIKSGTKIISDAAFNSLSELESIVLPDSIEIIEERAFINCKSLESINLPVSLQTIGEYAFYGCNKIKKINIDENNNYFKVDSGFILSKDGSRLIYAIPSLISDKVIIPNGVSEISEGAFLKNEIVRHVYLPDTLKSIGKFAFEGCMHLEKMDLPEGLISIEEGCFYHSTIKEITIPSSVKRIGVGAFSACYSLENINVNLENLDFISVDGVLLTANKLTLLNYPAASKVKAYKVPRSIYLINSGAFESCLYLERVLLPDALQEISEHTFSNCKALKQINIPQEIFRIGVRAFYGCTMLEYITLPLALKYLGNEAFNLCRSLRKINIPANLNSIGEDTFQYNENLKISVNNNNNKFRVFDGMLYRKSNYICDLPTIEDKNTPF